MLSYNTQQAWLSLLLESKAMSFSSQVTVYVCFLHSTVVLPSVDEGTVLGFP